jgi:hypothetical protein
MALPASPEQDPLSQLRDIKTPTGVDWWPLDWGWWLLMLLSVVVLIALIVFIKRRIAFNRPRKEALKALETISEHADDWPVQFNTLLKRTALSYFPKERISSLHNQQWRDFLLASCPKNAQALNEGLTALHANLYRNSAQHTDFAVSHDAVKMWIKNATFPRQHRIPSYLEATS